MLSPAALCVIALLAQDDTSRQAAAIPAAQDDPGVLRPPEPGMHGVVVLATGDSYSGRIVAVVDGRISVRVEGDTLILVPAQKVRGVIVDRVPHGSLAGRAEVRLVLANASVLAGALVESTNERVVLDSAGADRREVPAEQVKRIVRLREEGRPVEPAPRHLEAPSAFLLPHGDIHVSAVQGAHLSASMGVAGFAAVTVGTGLPVLHAEPYGPNVQMELRGGLAPWRHLRVAAGVHLDVSTEGDALAFLSATVTLGSPAAHVSLHAGPMFPGANLLGEFGDVGLALAGTYRASRRIDLLAEGWVSRGERRTDVLLATALRLRAARAAFDFGVARVSSDGAFLPWLGITVDATP